jgi:hypothetical protein
MRGELSDFVRDTLLPSAGSDLGRWFDARRVARLVEDHIAGRGNYTEELDKLTTIALASARLLR